MAVRHQVQNLQRCGNIFYWHPRLPSRMSAHIGARLSIDHVKEAAARAVAYERSGNRDSQMALVHSRAADENNVALVGKEGAGGQFPHQDFIDGLVGEVEVVDVFCQRQLGNTELVANGPGLFFGDLRLQKVTDNVWWVRAASRCRCPG